MPNFNFNDSVYVGTPDGSVGIDMNDQSSLITYNGGLINSGGYIYPLSVAGSGAVTGGYTVSTSDTIVLLNGNFIRAAPNTVFLGNHSNGKIVHFRRIDASVGNYIIQASGSDVIRLGSTATQSFTVAFDQAYTLAYNSGVWWSIRAGGSPIYTPPAPAP